MVSLNCRTLENRGEGHLGHAQRVVSISVRADCARCALASATGPAPSSAVSARPSCRVE